MLTLALIAGCLGAPPVPGEGAEAVLRRAGWPTDAAGLVKHLRERTPREASVRRVRELVADLASEDFDRREAATAALLSAGPVAVVPLREAGRAGQALDPEAARRVAACLARLEGEHDPRNYAAAVERLLSLDAPDASAAVTEFAAFVMGDPALRDSTITPLTAWAARKKEPPPELVAAAGSPDAARRWVAVRVLTSAFELPAERVRPWLTDADPMVRYEAAAARVRRGNADVVPTLVALIGAPGEASALAEDVLLRLTGELDPPTESGRAAWEKWWAANRGRVDVAKVMREDGYRNRTLVLEVDSKDAGFNQEAGRLWECGPDRRPRWEWTRLGGPVDAHPLPEGRVLVAEYYNRRVTERDRDGKVVWESQKFDSNPVSVQRLPNGNTLVATLQELFEVTPAKGLADKYPRHSGTMFQARRARDGRTYCLTSAGIVELDAKNRVVRTVPAGSLSGWAGFDVLPNGHFLVATYKASNRVVEIDGAGNVVWELAVPSPTRVQRLRNGNLLIAGGDATYVAEYNRAKEQVWRVETKGRPFGAVRH